MIIRGGVLFLADDSAPEDCVKKKITHLLQPTTNFGPTPTMPISLHKVTKKIKAKKGGKLDSLGRRDSKKLNRATLRDQKLKKLGTSRSKLKEVECKSLLRERLSELIPNKKLTCQQWFAWDILKSKPKMRRSH